jgi:hypothetical protein
MDHFFPDPQGDIHPGDLCFFREAKGVIQHGLISANADE